MEYKCDQCTPAKFFKTKARLRRHEGRVHDKDKGKSAAGSAAAPIFEVKKPSKKTNAPEPGGYHCNNCGAPLTKGQDPCPACGEELNWEGIE